MKKRTQHPQVDDRVAAAYGRLSSEDQAGNASARGQVAEAEAFCQEKGFNLLYTYFDEAKSGKSVEGRDQLQRMMEDARAGKFKRLVVWKLTRLSRNLAETLVLINELDSLGVSVHSISEVEYDSSTAHGKFMLHVMASVAEFDREVIVENVRMGMRQRAMEGAWVGGEMLGYRVPDEKTDPEPVVKAGRLIIVEGEAEIVKMIFALYAGGKGLKAIANRLNHGGYKTKRKGFFSSAQVGAILDNPAYIGSVRFRSHGGHAAEKELVVENAHPPIIARELWDRVSERRASKRERPRRVSERGFPLTGLLRCPKCGYGMVMHRTTNTRKSGAKWVQHYYACGRWKNQGRAACHFNGIPADDAERTVFRRLKRVVTHPTLLRDVVKRVNAVRKNAQRPLQQRMMAIGKERRHLETARDRYRRAFEFGALEAGEFGARAAEIRENLSSLATEEESLRAQFATGDSAEDLPYEVVKVIMDSFLDQFQRGDTDRQRALLRSLVLEITFEKGKGITSIRLHLHEGVAQALGLEHVPAIAAPLTLTA